MFGITPMMEAMLRSLAMYKYLTVSHVLALKISKSKDRSRKYFLELMKMGLVDRQIHTSVSENAKKKGFLQRTRNEYLWYLTLKGAKFLINNTEITPIAIRFPKRPEKWLKNDYFHRVSTIFINISFDQWYLKMGWESRQFLVYYDNNKIRQNRKFQAETRLDLGLYNHYTPDVICSFSDRNTCAHVFCLEVYNGKKIGYVEQQLTLLFGILDHSRKIEQKVSLDTVPRILVTLDDPSVLSKILSRLSVNSAFHVEGIEQLILFNLDTVVRNDFGKGWVNINGKPTDLVNLDFPDSRP